MSEGHPRGCGGDLRMVVRDLRPDELPPWASSGQSGHSACFHPDGTVFHYPGVATPAEQLAHEMPEAAAVLMDADDHNHND